MRPMGRRIAMTLVLVLLPVAHATAASGVPITVSPKIGAGGSTFAVSFVAPATTGIVAGKHVRDELTVTSRSTSTACRSSVTLMLSTMRKGRHVRVRLGSGWCKGAFTGKLAELASPVCPPGSMCPMYIRYRVLGAFSFAVH